MKYQVFFQFDFGLIMKLIIFRSDSNIFSLKYARTESVAIPETCLQIYFSTVKANK